MTIQTADLYRASDPTAAYRMLLDTCRHDESYAIGLESDGTTMALHRSRTPLAVLGPQQSGKSSAVLASAILSAPGPVVCVTTQLNLLSWTAHARATLGPIWHFSPSGESTPPGISELRWSPIAQAGTSESARQVASAMMVSNQSGGMPSENSQYFADWAGFFVASALFLAHHFDQPIEVVRRWVMSGDREQLRSWFFAVDFVREIIESNERFARLPSARMRAAVIAAADVIDIADPDAPGRAQLRAREVLEAEPLQLATNPNDTAAMVVAALVPHAAALGELVDAMLAKGEREWGSTVGTAAAAMRAYLRPAACEITRDPNFDPNIFIASPDGRYPTLYVTATAQDQNDTASLVAGVIQSIYDAAERRARIAPNSEPFLHLILDECANIAPLRRLPSIISEAANARVSVICGFQSFAQPAERWPEAARSWNDLFPGKLTLRGLSEPDTLNMLAALVGDHWVEVHGETIDPAYPYHIGGGINIYRPKTTPTMTRQRVPIRPPSMIANVSGDRANYWNRAAFRELVLTPIAGYLDANSSFTPYDSTNAMHQASPPLWVSLLARVAPLR